MKHWMCMFLGALFLVSTAATAYGSSFLPAEKSYYVNLDGNLTDPSQMDALLKVNNNWILDDFPVLEQGFALIPIRVVSEALGAKVDWDDDAYSVTITQKNPDKEIILRIGRDTAMVDGQSVSIDAPPKLINDRTYVHSRFVAEILDYAVDYDDQKYTFSADMVRQYANLDKSSLPVISIYKNADGELDWTLNSIVGLMEKDAVILPFKRSHIDEGALFIYNNFPEMIQSNIYYETYVNQTTNVTGRGRLFLSHGNYAYQKIDYIIRFENPYDLPSEITMVKDLAIHTDETYPDLVVRNHNLAFYEKLDRVITETVILEPGETLNLAMQNIGHSRFFTGRIDFNITHPVDITSFVVPAVEELQQLNYSLVETPAIPYDYDYVPENYIPLEIGMAEGLPHYTLYSGAGNGYEIYMEGAVNASSLEGSNYNIGFETGGTGKNINERHGVREIIAIELVEPRGEYNQITKAEWVGNIPYVDEPVSSDLRNVTRNYGNLGNWAADYYISTTLNNDTDNEATYLLHLLTPYQATFVVGDNEGNFYTVNHNNKIYYNTFQKETGEAEDLLKFNPLSRSWQLFKITVPPGEERVVHYMYSLGTDSVANVFHIWSLE